MKNECVGHDRKQHHGGGAVQRSGRANGFIPSSLRTLSSYMRVVSSGASTVASTVRSATASASSIVDKDCDSGHDQVSWAGFDKLECEGSSTRRVLLLGYQSGFQVWDVEEADNVHDLVSKHDGPVSFLQMLPNPLKSDFDKFVETRPLLVICAGCPSRGGNSNNGSANFEETCIGGSAQTTVHFYSLRSQSYIHVIKFRTAVYSLRCSSRIVAISQAAQIHCFNASTLEREYTILTNPITTASPGSAGGVGYGPLAVGPRWLAYSGSAVALSNSGRVSPQHLTSSASFSSNGSMVAHYAKKSSKQLANGVVTLGDMGYKKLSRYYSDLLPDTNNSGWKGNGSDNGHLTDTDNVGMVIVRDIVSKSVVSQFRAHKSPISALCFDPSGTLLVTASIQGHNINIFQVQQGLSESSTETDINLSFIHLYKLQRGLTNAVIQDISFSIDLNWIMISSSRGTSHLFSLPSLHGSVESRYADANSTVTNNNVSGQKVANQQNIFVSDSPITISAVSRIRSGNSGWRGAVTGAASSAATGKPSSPSCAIASSFCKYNSSCATNSFVKANQSLLVFSPSGSMIQYALRMFPPGIDSVTGAPKFGATYESCQQSDARLVVEAIQKWNICQKQNRRDREEDVDIYGENGISKNNKICREGVKKGNNIHPGDRSTVFNKVKVVPEEKNHLYISEAELHMHQTHAPLWERPEIYFQSMTINDLRNSYNNSEGEIEIEKIGTRTIEARSKSLVPVCGYIQTPQVLQTRVRGLEKSGISENGRLSIEETSKGYYVHNNEKPRSNTGTKYVNNHKEGLKMENQFEDI